MNRFISPPPATPPRHGIIFICSQSSVLNIPLRQTDYNGSDFDTLSILSVCSLTNAVFNYQQQFRPKQWSPTGFPGWKHWSPKAMVATPPLHWISIHITHEHIHSTIHRSILHINILTYIQSTGRRRKKINQSITKWVGGWVKMVSEWIWDAGGGNGGGNEWSFILCA